MCLSRFIGVILLCCSATAGAAAPTRVSLLLGDVSTKQTLDVVQEVLSTHSLPGDLNVRVYSSTDIRTQDMEHLAKSDLVVVLVRGRGLLDSVKDELAQAIRRGGKVYAVGESYNDNDRALGISVDPALRAYFETGGRDNVKNGFLYALTRLGLQAVYQPVREMPKVGLYDAASKEVYTGFDAYRQHYAGYREGRPWVGLLFYESNVQAGSTRHIDAVIAALEQRGYNVLPAYGFPPEKPIEHFFFDDDGRGRVDAVVAVSVKIGVMPDKLLPVLERLDVPVINAISLYSMSRAEWEASPVGLDIMERSWQLGLPEMAGLIQPTVFAAKEKIKDPETGVEYVEERAIPERVEMLARRIDRWITLRHKPNAEKRLLLHYFNFPPGKNGIGASYLNVVPESLWQVMMRLKAEGYDLAGMPETKEALRDAVVHYGSNIPKWDTDQVASLAQRGKGVLLPVETYKKWFAELPKSSQDDVIKSWGRPEDNEMMAYEDDEGRQYMLLPVLRYGKVILAPQPSKGWTENPEKLFHDTSIPPSHQYIAFYLWLQKEFQADGLLQFGTHGTHEWLPGKEAGLSADNPPEYLMQDLPNLYAFIVDDPGEGTQAKRRGLAVMINHMTPPFDKAGLNPELNELKQKLNDYQAAREKSPALAEAHLAGINELAERIGIFKDIGTGKLQVFHGDMEHPEEEHDHAAHDFSQDPALAIVDKLVHYLQEIGSKLTPFGLHTLGKAPDDKAIRSTAEAVVSLERDLSDEQSRARVVEYEAKIRQSAVDELNAVVAGFAGRFITANVGGDPVRNPAVYPTGKNFYSFDTRRMPAQTTYALGVKLANELIEGYKQRHGDYPDKLTFNLWGVESMRHEGVSESQILYLMGVRPVWDARGIVRGVEPIPREELGRARIDVTVVPSGLFRDLFSNIMALLDQAVSVAMAQEEADNHLRLHTQKTQAMLREKGVQPELAARMAAVRLFSVPSGAYGTNVNFGVERSDTWDDEKQVIDIYFMRMSHMYGQGFWGDDGEGGGQKGLGRDLLKNALSGSKIAIHSRSSNVYQTLDGDDFFQYLGGTAMAIRAVDGRTPEVYVSNLSNVADAKQETLEKMMGREMRTRYLNPEWIKAMMKEGYAGAKFMNETVQNMWGWQVTVPEAVDAAKWKEMYETYVNDRYDLDMNKFFRDAGNLWAYQELMVRMLEAVRKGYWQADQAVVENLGKRVSELIEELQQHCDAEHCHDPLLTKLVQAKLVPVPSPAAVALAAAPPAPSDAGQLSASPAPGPDATRQTQGQQQVKGYAMEEVRRMTASASGNGEVQWLGFLLLCQVLLWGFYGAYQWRYGAWRGRRVDVVSNR